MTLFAPPNVELHTRSDGSSVLRSRTALEPCARCIGDWLEQWAQDAPQAPFLAERDAAGGWHVVSYGDALRRVRQIGAWLLERGASASRPLAILSENSVEHALAMLGAMHVGVPSASISPAYSLLTRDFARLQSIVRALEPSVIFAARGATFAPALQAIHGLHQAAVTVGALPGLDDEARTTRAFNAVGPDTIAKLLFTSGSTNEPKAVINTQRMLCSNQQAIAQIWPFLARSPPIVVDWLPWSHTFGANHNFNLVLRNGGTLYIDGGRPAPGLFDASVVNLKDIAPTIYFNVPRGFDMLVAALRGSEELRRTFFSRMQLVFYAAAALPQNLWDAMRTLARETVGRDIPLVSAWGATETAPLVTSCHFQAERSGVIGLPIPGCELKLARAGERIEIRVRGPNVTPGYWKRPDLTATAFDDEGFYLTGDAARFVNSGKPELGLLFDGRIAENFKLTTGTWVNVGMLRVRAIEALAPIAADVVIAGHERDEIGLLIFPNQAGCRSLCESSADPLLSAAVRLRVQQGLAELHAAGGGSSTFASRALLLADAPSIDAGEITDKGYVNQRRVLERRAAFVERLFSSADAGVIYLKDAVTPT